MSKSNIEAMHRIFREQHRQMIEEQKKLLDDYKHYFDGVLKQMEEYECVKDSSVTAEEDVVKEISEISTLLNDAVQVYGKELADILFQIKEKKTANKD